MRDEPTPATGARVRTREQLLHALHDDPHNVSRAEIKAAFADGRLGDQDLEIPVLAGMRRITELLAELQTDGAGVAPAGPVADAANPTVATRPVSTSTRLTELDERITHLEGLAAEQQPAPPSSAPPSPTVQEVTDLRASIERLESVLPERDRRLGQLSMLVAVSIGVAVIALLVALLVH